MEPFGSPRVFAATGAVSRDLARAPGELLGPGPGTSQASRWEGAVAGQVGHGRFPTAPRIEAQNHSASQGQVTNPDLICPTGD